jgi:hypothetical protein
LSFAKTSAAAKHGGELFRFERANRYTDSGATNAAAKEVIKRILKLRSLQNK